MSDSAGISQAVLPADLARELSLWILEGLSDKIPSTYQPALARAVRQADVAETRAISRMKRRRR